MLTEEQVAEILIAEFMAELREWEEVTQDYEWAMAGL